MYIMYVDESGDTGRKLGSTLHFCLSGIVVHESRWRDLIKDLVAFRRVLRSVYGLSSRVEVHASEFMQKKIANLAKPQRLALLRNFLDEIAQFDYISITNVVVDKNGKPLNYDVFECAWRTLFQRFENTMKNGNFPGAHRADFGMVVTDAVAGKKLVRNMRKMAVYNPVPNMQQYGPGYRNIPLVKIIEDPSGRDSRESLPIQAADVVAYFLKQSFAPSKYIKDKRAHNYLARLQPVLNTRASRDHPLGIVVL